MVLEYLAPLLQITGRMGDVTKTRRDYLTIAAADGRGGSMNVLISYDRLRAVGCRSMGQTLEAAEIVPIILQRPTAIFEGLCDDCDESHRGVGWRCHVGIPDRSYTAGGQRREAWEDKVFLVFTSAERVAYNWRWEKCDPDNPKLPFNHARRFKTRIL